MLELLKELKRLNIKLKLVDNNIKIISIDGKLPNDIVDKIKKEKTNLIEYLKNGAKAKNRIFTPSDFTYKGLTIEEVDSLCKKYDIEDIYRLTPMQEGMLFHAILDPNSQAYFEQFAYRMSCELKVDLVVESLNELFKRHDILRTVFIHKDLQCPVQVVLKNRECGFLFQDIRNLSPDMREQFIKDSKIKDREQGFILDHDVLMRVILIQLGDNEYELIWSNHHILMDGWCLSIINNDFFQIYNSLLNKKEVGLPVVTPFREYIKWLGKIDKKDSLKYWKEYLLDYEEPATIPCKTKNSELFVQRTESIHFSKEVSSKLQSISTDNSVTPNIFLQCAWAIILGKYSCKQDIVFGSVVSGRPSDLLGIESIVGLFINNIPVRVQYSLDEPFSCLLKRVQKSSIESVQHHYISLAEIQSQSLIKQDLIENIIVFENYPIEEQIEKIGNSNEHDRLNLKISNVETYEQTNYNLTISAFLNVEFGVNLNYNSIVYDPHMMARLKVHLENTIIETINNPDVPISAINILSAEEKHQLLYEFNGTQSDCPKNKTIHQLFEEQVEQNLENTALVFDGMDMTYKELNERGNQVASALRDKGVKPNDIVGLMIDRSFELIIGVLGVLKSGAAYLPIDSNYPEERKRFILKESGVKYVLFADKEKNKALELSDGIESINLLSDLILKARNFNLEIVSKETDLLYVIYTSGTTGKPKGVMLDHRNLFNLLDNNKNTNLTFNRVLQFTSISFDVSFQEIFSTLLFGGTLVLISEDDRLDTKKFTEIIQQERIETLFLPTSFTKFIFNQGEGSLTMPESVKHIITAGEQLIVSRQFQDYLKKNKVYLHNHYGPTESHVVTIATLSPDEEIPEIPVIGQPIQNTSIYILDSSKNLLPIGITGELYIGGIQVGRGYYKDTVLTSEKFINHPFKQGERLYRTGDLARWLPNGNIEFLGRIDHQVKIRGYRIELGEIESILSNHENVSESVVLALEKEGEKYLCAYVVLKKDENSESLSEYLRGLLPEYMIPSYIIQLDSLPLTSNGKIDRKSLPSPEYKSVSDYVAPSNTVELKLAEIWSEVLAIPVEKISITESFFSLGGHSLKAILLINRIRKVLEVEVTLSAFMANPTIKYLSLYINGLSVRKYASIRAFEKKEYYPISSVQKRFYFIQNLEPESTTFNTVGAIPISKNFSYDKILSIFNSIIERHDAFRTFFISHNNSIVQRIVDKANITIETCNIKMNEIDEFVSNYRKPFDLSKYPILKIVYFIVEDNNENDYILYNTHHIFTDGQTHQILENDFLKLLNNEKLAPLRLQYKDYSEWQNSKEHRAEIKEKEKYWLDVFKNGIPEINLPTDYPCLEIINWEKDCSNVGMVFDNNYAKKIKKLVDSECVSLYMFFFSAINILLNKISGNNDFVIGSFALGRNIVDLENIVGAFINTLVIRNTLNVDTSYKEFLKNTAQNIVQATENQDYQFDDLVDLLKIKRKPNRDPIFDIMLTLNENNYPLSREEEERLKKHTKVSGKVDLIFELLTYHESIVLSIIYCDKLFLPQTIDRFLSYLKTIIDAVLLDVNVNLSDIKLVEIERISKKERQDVDFDI